MSNDKEEYVNIDHQIINHVIDVLKECLEGKRTLLQLEISEEHPKNGNA